MADHEILNLHLKGHCHAIWQLYKKPEGSSHQLNLKTNDLVLLFRLFECTETVSCRLSVRMAWGEMD